MKTPIIMAAVGLLLIFTGVVGIASSLETGESFDLDETFGPYLPGNPLPVSASCDSGGNMYSGYFQTLCRVRETTYCEHGYIVAQDAVIVHTTFFRCNFPIAYLIAEYGRYERVRHYRRVQVLRWPNIYAHVRRSGWLNIMEPVYIVTWWRPATATNSQQQANQVNQ